MLACCLALCAADSFAPSADYARTIVQGWTLRIHPEVARHPGDGAAARAELDGQLARIAAVVAAGPLAELRKTPIWIEWAAKPRGAAEFHPSRDWLVGHGYNPEKAGAVEINNCRNFVAWSRRSQPWMVLHELAHSYHFRKLGAGHAGIAGAFAKATARGLYDAVAHVDGGPPRRAYAMTDDKEYFAELSEAYFGKNDFFPFDRAELAKHDPDGFRVLRAVWGEPQAASSQPPAKAAEGPTLRK